MDDDILEQENNVIINLKGTLQTPKKDGIIYNSKMALNRSVAFCALSAYIDTSWSRCRPIRCLDANGATGVAGLSWAKNLSKISVTINDPLEKACEKIKLNQDLNNVDVEITQKNVNVLLYERSFDFVFLDCYGSSVQYLASVFKNIPKNGLLVITSTDEAALYGKAPDVTLRNYGGFVVKTFYYKELAARLIVAAAAREAAKCNKGIEVLSCVAVRSHIAVILRIGRGPTAATACVHQINKVIHCCICEDRAFLSDTVHPIEEPYSYLSCKCREKTCPKIAKELGPVWTGPLFNYEFCSAMLKHATLSKQPSKVQNLLEIIVNESDCTILEPLNRGSVGTSSSAAPKSEPEEEMASPSKKQKLETIVKCPPFYYNLHKHSPKGYDLGKLNTLVVYIRTSGHLASRTHFDPDAIRTSASLKELKQILIQFCCLREY